MLPVKGIVFLALNVIRLLSTLAFVFVFSTTIALMATDSNAYSRLRAQGELQDATDEYEYLPYSGIPTTTWGLFWSEFSQACTLSICLVCMFSDLAVGSLERLYTTHLAILGHSFSTAPLGVIQVILASSLLSRYTHGFTLVAPWILFWCGLLNVAAGIAFGPRIRYRRSFFRKKRDLLDQQIRADIEKGNADPTPFADAIRSLAKTGIGEVGQRSSRRARRMHHEKDQPTSEQHQLLPVSAPTIKPIRNAMDAFHKYSQYGVGVARNTATTNGLMSVSPAPGGVVLANASIAPSNTPHDEVLRWRARQENMRAEKRQEQYEECVVHGRGRSAAFTHQTNSHLSRHFAWDEDNEIAIPRQTPESERQISALLFEMGVRDDRTVAPNADLVPREQEVAARTAPSAPKSKGFRRRTLVLSKMVSNVKRGSISAASCAMQAARIRKRPRSPVVGRTPRMPGAYRQTAHRGLRTGERSTQWTTVEQDHPPVVNAPPPTYIPSGTHDYVQDGEDARSRYHSLPAADRFATT